MIWRLAKFVHTTTFCASVALNSDIQITIVGQIVSIQMHPTNHVYTIDDGTGRIEARHYVDSTSEEEGSKWRGIEYALLFLPAS